MTFARGSWRKVSEYFSCNPGLASSFQLPYVPSQAHPPLLLTVFLQVLQEIYCSFFALCFIKANWTNIHLFMPQIIHKCPNKQNASIFSHLELSYVVFPIDAAANPLDNCANCVLMGNQRPRVLPNKWLREAVIKRRRGFRNQADTSKKQKLAKEPFFFFNPNNEAHWRHGNELLQRPF